MRRWWWTGMLAVIVLAGLGCKREGGDADARAFDANREVAGGSALPAPDKNLLADQTEISRRVKEARATPAATPATGTASGGVAPGAPGATGGTDGNTPQAALTALARALATGDKAAFLALTNVADADRQLFGAMLDMMRESAALTKDAEKAYGKDAAAKIEAPSMIAVLTEKNVPRFKFQETGDKAVATLRTEEPGKITVEAYTLVRTGGKWLLDVTQQIPPPDKRAESLQAVSECVQTLTGLRGRVGKEGETVEKIAADWMAAMLKALALMPAPPPPPPFPGAVPGPEANSPVPTAPPPDGVPTERRTAPPPDGIPTVPLPGDPPLRTAPPPDGAGGPRTAPPPDGAGGPRTAPPPDGAGGPRTAPPPDRPSPPPPT